MTENITTHQVYRVYIKATPEAIWEAITTPEWSKKYGYQAPVSYDLRPGGAFQCEASEAMKEHGAPDNILDGEVVEVDPPRKLVQTWRAVWTGEGFTRLTYELEEEPGGITKLTLIHDLQGAPQTAAQIAGELEGAGGGWSQVLSDLKTLLETGKPMYS
ncbi:SRPBCC domain-containing protein [Actinopolymorpha alba]|uniref:SRPBCC domain-containing protein n=1 Tax=Actinopolymorpha alba TaxID=533267 RepID=UPI00036E1683|nr:SRPBCC domain-containing protein [Actinopolymorpha alba]